MIKRIDQLKQFLNKFHNLHDFYDLQWFWIDDLCNLRIYYKE